MEREGAAKAIALRALGLLALIFVVLVGLRLHGFSLPQWHKVLDGSAAPEVLAGEPRYIRADDWLVQLPLAFAQSAHEPSFPVVNENIGDGQNMLLPIVAPVSHPVALFRPNQLGFFLGNDFGLAWLWWSQVLGLVGVFFVISLMLTRGDAALSAAGAILLAVSPYFQFWAFTKSTIPIYMGIAFLATTRILSERSPLAIGLYGLLLAWAGIAFAVVLYPPWQLPLLYLYFVLVAAWAWERKGDAPWRSRLAGRLGTGIGAAAVAISVLALLYFDAREAIESILGTVYPGRRFSTGGGLEPYRLLTAHFASGAVGSDFREFGTIVGASSFVFFFPVVGAAMAWFRVRDPMSIALLLYCVCAAIYQFIGIPDWLARISLLSFATEVRFLLGLGIADALLLLRFLSLPRNASGRDRIVEVGVVLSWAGVLYLGGRQLQEHLPGMTSSVLGIGVVVNTVFAYAILRRARAAWVLGGLCLVVAATTLHFNPLVQGGADYLANNPLSQSVREIDADHDGQTTWLVYDSSDIPNLLRTIGVDSFGGVYPLPQLSLWRKLDPAEASIEIYNRYAHVGFRPTRKRWGEPVRFRLSSPHGFIVYLDPEGSEIKELGVTHLIVREKNRSRDYWAGFIPDRVVGRHTIFELPLRRRAAN